MTKATTIVAPALASGIKGKDARNCALSLEAARAPAPKPVKSVKEAPAPKAPKAKPSTEATGLINRAGRIVLKGNAKVRAELKAAGQGIGASRLVAHGFADYSAFLNGFEFKATAGVGDKARMAITFTGPNAPEKGKAAPAIQLIIAADGSYKIT